MFGNLVGYSKNLGTSPPIYNVILRIVLGNVGQLSLGDPLPNLVSFCKKP
jgi:hypothetical protein